MEALERLFMAQKEKEAAYNLYNYAGERLELAKIKERLAYLRSQHEPLHGFIKDKGISRDDAVKIAEHVVLGKLLNQEAHHAGMIQIKENE